MVILSIISMLAGMVLGQRFKVLVLVPALGATLVVGVAVGAAQARGLWPTVLMAVAAIGSLQIGYLAGIGTRHLLAALRTGGLRNAFRPAPTRMPAPAPNLRTNA